MVTTPAHFARINAQTAALTVEALASVSIRDYGAVGDGVHDDTAAIQNALTHAGADGVVLVPNGTFRITSGLTMPLSGTLLCGYGSRSIIQGDYTGSVPMLTVGVTTARTDRQGVWDITLNGVNGGHQPDTALQIIRSTNCRVRGLAGAYLAVSLLDLRSVWESHFIDIRGQLIGSGSTTSSGIIWLHPDAGSLEDTVQNHFSVMNLGSTIGTVLRLDGGASAISSNHFIDMAGETYPSGGPYASDATAQLIYLDNASGNEFTNFSFNVNSRADTQSAYAIESSGTNANRGNLFTAGSIWFSKSGSQTNVPTGFARTSRGSLWFTNVEFRDFDNLIANNLMLKVDTSSQPDLFHRIHLRDCYVWTDKTYSQLFADPVFILGTFSMQQVSSPFTTKQIDQRFLAKDVTAYPSSSTTETNLAQVAINNYAIGYTNGLRIHAAGSISGAAGVKTIKLYFDLQSITLLSATATTSDWRLEAEALWSGLANWVVSWVFYNGTTVAGQGCAALTEGTVAYPIKLTGQCASGTDTITQKIFVVERMDTR